MKTISPAITMTLAVGILVTMFGSQAVAGCGDLSSLQGPFRMASTQVQAKALAAQTADVKPDQRGGTQGASIVGMWQFQLISKGNESHNPPIPDGALLDFGFTHWHSDGTELIESGGHSPASSNFCLGVWGQTGFLAYEINHFPIAYDPTTGQIANYINLREQVTLSPSGDSFSGTLTEDVYDPMGKHLDSVAGTVVASRITLDSTIPGAIPDKP
ncbi:MAG TPA: hypothetical protein VKG25_20490 [Bryobacteraceae bacterium]|nr:hypothetical protein [Bryobacteraceae bacterium]